MVVLGASKSFFIFAILSFFWCPRVSASFFSEEVKPVLQQATDETSLALWLGGAASVLILQPQDHGIQERWGQHRLMPEWQTNIGDRYISYGGNVGIALIQLAWDRPHGVNHARALIYTTGITQAIKVTVHQQRPDNSDAYAFPSGHTSSAFATATSLSYAYGWKAGVPSFAMATFTGLSRISADKHWASDVVAGAFLGVIWGRATVLDNSKESSSLGRLQFKDFFPSFEEGLLALNFMREF